jgi:Cyclic nucleotide-binding domain
VSMATAYDLLAGHPFLSGLTKRQLERLANWSQRSFFHAGNRVFHEGDRADRFWLIQEGRVQLDTYLRDRDELVVVDTLGPVPCLAGRGCFRHTDGTSGRSLWRRASPSRLTGRASGSCACKTPSWATS